LSTVVYRNGVLAADRQVTSDTVILGQVRKIFAAPGCLVGITGAYGDAMAFVAWAKDGFDPKKRPDTTRDVEAVIVKPDGAFVVRGSPNWTEETIGSDFYASGSGSHIAMGALAMGADSVQAVEIACQFDIFSGGGIDVLRLEDIQAPIKRVAKPPVKKPNGSAKKQ